uniref:UvrABC system protein C n=1 Tax=Desulfomonile tiedjei TaxID=2358 RepID=A0A7C4EWA2_9BACT
MAIDEQFLSTLPTSPGVYVMEGADGAVLYVGKAGNLRNRVKNYFVPGADERPSVKFLVQRVHAIRTILTETEKEALILENNLIKEHRPRYNVNLRDDKSFFSLRLDQSHRFPRLTLVRTQRIKKDGARYFGPYTSARDARITLNLLLRLFPLRRCTNRQFSAATRPCLNFQMKRCLSPCTGQVGPEEYSRVVRSAVLFLQGNADELVSQLKKDMEDAAARLHFEEAARIRDQLLAVERTIEAQNVAFFHNKDQDVIAVIEPETSLYVMTVLSLRRGNLISEESFVIRNQALERTEIISSALRQYYHGAAVIPSEILLSEPIDQQELIESWLASMRGARVCLKVPSRGQGIRLISLAKKNAHNAYQRQKQQQTFAGVLEHVARKFGLSGPPKVVEAYDISNTAGSRPVGVKVSFANGKPQKSSYRRYRIKGFTDQNDPAMIHQVVLRRMAHQDKDPLPNLMLIDGGKSQLNAAHEALKTTKEGAQVAVVAIAKGRNEGESDYFYLPNRKNPVVCKASDPALLFLMKVRDEAHRFAHAYHSKLRGQQMHASWLDDIPGIGPKKKQALLKAFGSVRSLLEASDEAILAVNGIGKKDVERLRDYSQSFADAGVGARGRESGNGTVAPARVNCT